MSCGSAFTIDSSDLVLGAILARGALGVTVYTADLKMGQQSLKASTCLSEGLSCSGPNIASLVSY